MNERIAMSSDAVIQSFRRLEELGLVVRDDGGWWTFTRLPDTAETFLLAVRLLRFPQTNVIVEEGDSIRFQGGFTG